MNDDDDPRNYAPCYCESCNAMREGTRVLAARAEKSKREMFAALRHTAIVLTLSFAAYLLIRWAYG